MPDWKKINEYPNYSVDENGNVLNTKTNKTLKPLLNKRTGYYYVNLYKDRKEKHVDVHRLVAQAFIPNPQVLPQVNHIDEIKTNNKAENLEWCTQRYNLNYGERNNRVVKSNINHPNKSVYVYCVELDTVFPSGREASRKTGVDFRGIMRTCKGEQNTAGNYHWQYDK